MNEAQLQSQCVLWFSQEYPKRRGDLFATFQETNSAAQGSNMLSKGLIPGVSDIIYTDFQKRLIGIEMKAPNTYHDLIHVLEQCRFIRHNAYHGFFCTTLEDFKTIIESDGTNGMLKVEDVLMVVYQKMLKNIPLSGLSSIDDLIFQANRWEKKTKKKMPRIKF